MKSLWLHFWGTPRDTWLPQCSGSGKVTTVVTTLGQGPECSQEVAYRDIKVIGSGSFGVMYQAWLADTRELVAIRKFLQDKRFKNWELQIMRKVDHCNIARLRCFLYFKREKKDVIQLLSHVWLFVTPWTAWKHARLPWPSLSPGVCSNSCPLIQWCHPTISSSVTPFSSCPQSFPASRSFPVSWLFTTGDQSIGASASVLPMNIQNWFPLGLTSLIYLLPKGLSRLFSTSTVWKHQFLVTQPSLWSNSHICTWLLGKPLLFSHSVMSDSLWPHGLQHTRLPCPSLSPRVCSNSCPLNQWCHP